jgi:hypothetical protein
MHLDQLLELAEQELRHLLLALQSHTQVVGVVGMKTIQQQLLGKVVQMADQLDHLEVAVMVEHIQL